MIMSTHTLARRLHLCLLGLSCLSASCKDESPCDDGQEERNAGCYPIAAGSAGVGGQSAVDSAAVDSGTGMDSAAPVGSQAVVGQPCADTAGSSDCGGPAPICAPLPAGAVCTQIFCLDGEANAGACPSDWPCRTIGANPSVCLNF
jgi:hypothetical protein